MLGGGTLQTPQVSMNLTGGGWYTAWGKGYRHPPVWHVQVPTGAQRAGQVCERSSRNICPLPWVQVLSLSPSFMFGVSLDSADHGGE